MIAATFVVAVLFTLALGSPVSRNMQVHEKRDSIPNGFVARGAAPLDQVLKLRIALKQSDPAGLEAALYDVSTPSSPNYGKYLTREEAASYAAPTAETASAVNAWLTDNGLTATPLTPAGDWLGFEIPVSKANEMFEADFSVFDYESTGKTSIRTLSYSIPESLKGHIDTVHPTTLFARPTTRKAPIKYVPKKRSIAERIVTRAGEVDASCANDTSPSCLQQLYGIPTTAATQSSNTLGVTGYSSQWPQTQDLQLFLSKYRTDIPSSSTFTVTDLDGGSDPQSSDDAGDEADLDVQYTVGLATGVPVIFLSVGDDNSDNIDGFLDSMNYFLGESDPPSAITTSYGFWEEDVSDSIANSLCNAYAQLGTRGTTILFASGDGGVSGAQSTSCTTFLPTFPSGCPYLTSVGATTGINPETAADFSAGGFSNIFPTPSYQAADVSAFLTTLGSTYSGLYNASGRGYPDVSTQGVNFFIGYEDAIYTVDGTSCASPTFASIIALLNDELLAAGKSTLGFLNPWLYSTAASAFNDVTSGDNPGCNTNGFTAGTGWDPVTGLGTPVFSALRTAAGL
ncbi:peptidase S8/S53 domain-containing protein [Amylocystis lapponica]|nr:peptidase S8/S53 domain-containing protein [Amylocystis lapponica]